MGRPQPGDFPEFAARYVDAAPGDTLHIALRAASEGTAAMLAVLPADRVDFRYAPGKWTVKDILQHLIDTERIFAYRALRFARNDATPLAGFDENDYAAAADASRRELTELVRELEDVRAVSVQLFNSFDAAALSRSGTANGSHVTVQALAWMIAGHTLHHMRIIRERYLS